MTETESTEAFLSTLHHALRATRRRYVVQLVTDADDTVLSVRSLAREIAVREHELPIEQATGEPYRNAYNALSQTHLPTLSDAGILIYDSNRQRVSRGPNFTLAAVFVAIDRPAVAVLQNLESAESHDPSAIGD